MFYVDTHIHLQDYKTQDVKNVVKNALKNNVKVFINASAHPDDWQRVTEIANKFAQIIPAYGVHPWYIKDVSANWLIKLENILRNNPHAWVGECGIDRFKNQDIDSQIEILNEHIELAQKYSRPLIVHAVKAENYLYPLLDKMPERVVFHSFNGSAEWGKKLQNQGFYLGFNFAFLRKKNAAEILQEISLERILLETDGPYQNIVPQSESFPKDIPQLAEKMADILNMEYSQFSKIIFVNQQRFIGEIL